MWLRIFPRYSVGNLEFFSGNLFIVSLITAIAKYIYCQNYELSRALLRSNLSFNFESFLPNHAKMAVILVFCHIYEKGIFFTFYFVIYVLLIIYFSKYLQFLLNIITDCQNHVTEHVFLEDNDSWKCKFFIFAIFIFSILHDFPAKTYEKTCCFYNIFSESISHGTHLTSFTIWVFFPKRCRFFQLNVPFSNFEPLVQKKYENTYRFCNIFPKFLSLCTYS